MDTINADDLVREHQGVVTRQARSIARRWRGQVEMEDLIGVGLFAALNAAKTFDSSHNVPLPAHTTRAARWAMLSEARTSGLARRGVVERRRSVLAAEAVVEQRHGRVASVEEVARELGVDRERIERWTREAGAMYQVPITDLEGTLAAEVDAPEDYVLHKELVAALRIAISALPARLRWIVATTFFEGRSLASVAAELSVSESRVSQLRADAVELLRDGLAILLGRDDDADSPDDITPAAPERPTRRIRSYRGALREAARTS